MEAVAGVFAHSHLDGGDEGVGREDDGTGGQLLTALLSALEEGARETGLSNGTRRQVHQAEAILGDLLKELDHSRVDPLHSHPVQHVAQQVRPVEQI